MHQGVSSCYLAICPVTGIDAINFVFVIDATAPSTSNVSLKQVCEYWKPSTSELRYLRLNSNYMSTLFVVILTH